MKNSTNIIAFITAFALHLIIGGVLLMNIDFSLPRDKPEAASIIDATIINQDMLDSMAKHSEQQKQAQQKIIDQQRELQAQQEAEKQRQQALVQKQKDDKLKAEKEEAVRKQQEQQRIENEKLAAAKEAEEKRQAEQAAIAAAEKKKADEAAKAEKAKADKLAAEKAAKAKADKLAAEKAAKEKADKLAAEKAAKEKADKLAAEKAAKEKADKLAAEKAAKEKADKLAAEKAAKAKAEKLAAEKAAKEKAERIAKQKAAAEKERLRQEELDRQMEAEFSDDFSSARSAKQTSEIARYQALIRSKISRNWKVDKSMSGQTCTLAIKLASNGLVLSAVMSKGDQKLCDSARRATLQAKTLPIPKDPEISGQFRDFDITLEPDL
ncbi:cell envelope integrity protein TolA [Psychromonas sp. KJ10-2]|uniref:cell envelope integrity protein TolA n=1 Tax=Psychromonas sp. KJ10-2 TaxID=3391822 RepID=UPI0039B511D1